MWYGKIFARLVSNAYQQLSDDFQKLLEDYESKVAECEFFQSQWNQLLRGKERLQQRGLVAVGRLDGWLAKASLSGSFPIIAIVTVF